MTAAAATAAWEGDGSTVITVSGGAPGQTFNAAATGDLSVAPGTGTFDARGEAQLTARSVAPFANSGSVTISSLGSTADVSITLAAWKITASAKQDPIDGTAGVVDWINYRKPVEIKLSGGKPGSEVRVSTSAGAPSPQTASVTLDSQGAGRVTVDPVTDYWSLSTYDVNFDYEQNRSQRGSLTYRLRLYPLTVDFNPKTAVVMKSEVVNDHVQIKLEGGYPGERVDWRIEGDGQLYYFTDDVSRQFSNFGSHGQYPSSATVGVYGRAPFLTPPTVIATTMGREFRLPLAFAP